MCKQASSNTPKKMQREAGMRVMPPQTKVQELGQRVFLDLDFAALNQPHHLLDSGGHRHKTQRPRLDRIQQCGGFLLCGGDIVFAIDGPTPAGVLQLTGQVAQRAGQDSALTLVTGQTNRVGKSCLRAQVPWMLASWMIFFQRCKSLSWLLACASRRSVASTAAAQMQSRPLQFMSLPWWSP